MPGTLTLMLHAWLDTVKVLKEVGSEHNIDTILAPYRWSHWGGGTIGSPSARLSVCAYEF